MRKFNNLEIATQCLNQLKRAFEKKPETEKFHFVLSDEYFSEPFDFIFFENMICSELKCTIRLTKRDEWTYIFDGELLNKISMVNGSKLIFKDSNSDDAGKGHTPLSHWDYYN